MRDTDRRLVSIISFFVGLIYVLVMAIDYGSEKTFDAWSLGNIVQISLAFALLVASAILFFSKQLLALLICCASTIYLLSIEIISKEEPGLITINFLLAIYFSVTLIRSFLAKPKQTNREC